VKDRALQTQRRATLLFVDPDNPYRFMEVRGNVVEEREEGARTHIDRLSKKYLGTDEYPRYQGETRVTYVVEPERIVSQG